MLVYFRSRETYFQPYFDMKKLKNTLNTLKNIFIAFNNSEISSKTHNQPEIKIIFEFKSTISNKFKGKKTLCINFLHQKKLIDTKTTYFLWPESVSTKTFFLCHWNPNTLSLIYQIRDQKPIINMK
jgi:hypothetical protein